MPTKQFYQVLGDLRAGELNEELTAKMTELVAAVQNTNKAGALTLTITLSPTKGLAIEIDAEVKLKKPELAKPTTLMYPTVDGNLQMQNPMQKSLDLTIVQDGGVKQFNSVGLGQPTTLAVAPGAVQPIAAEPTAPTAPTGT